MPGVHRLVGAVRHLLPLETIVLDVIHSLQQHHTKSRLRRPEWQKLPHTATHDPGQHRDPSQGWTKGLQRKGGFRGGLALGQRAPGVEPPGADEGADHRPWEEGIERLPSPSRGRVVRRGNLVVVAHQVLVCPMQVTHVGQQHVGNGLVNGLRLVQQLVRHSDPQAPVQDAHREGYADEVGQPDLLAPGVKRCSRKAHGNYQLCHGPEVQRAAETVVALVALAELHGRGVGPVMLRKALEQRQQHEGGEEQPPPPLQWRPRHGRPAPHQHHKRLGEVGERDDIAAPG
mmetsp:Transcript_87933/g.262227  ORF Transcript_87933/g.262227 Transcript_87933/m.262227 type:complete len:287 (+) Transcript_87933:396-1256(+)